MLFDQIPFRNGLEKGCYTISRRIYRDRDIRVKLNNVSADSGTLVISLFDI